VKYEMMELEPFIYTIKRQLLDAQLKHSGELGYFNLEDVELTLAVAIQSDIDGRVSLKVFSVGPELGAKMAGTQTSTVKLKFTIKSAEDKSVVQPGGTILAPSPGDDPGKPRIPSTATETNENTQLRYGNFPIFQSLARDYAQYSQHAAVGFAVLNTQGHEVLASIGWRHVPTQVRDRIVKRCLAHVENEEGPVHQGVGEFGVGTWKIKLNKLLLIPHTFWVIFAEPTSDEDRRMVITEEVGPIYLTVNRQ